jgi:hypothetical protein
MLTLQFGKRNAPSLNGLLGDRSQDLRELSIVRPIGTFSDGDEKTNISSSAFTAVLRSLARPNQTAV